jgi:hypothetical protein
MKESTESDFLRLGGGASDNGEDGDRSSGLLVIVVMCSEDGEESAVMKVSWERRETADGLKAGRARRSSR